MTDTEKDWARQLASNDNWEWLPGMLVHATVDGDASEYRLDGAQELYKESDILVHEQRIYDDTDDVADIFPDLHDPATIGCIWSMWRKSVEGMRFSQRVKAFRTVQAMVSEDHLERGLNVAWPDVLLFLDGAIAARAWLAMQETRP